MIRFLALLSLIFSLSGCLFLPPVKQTSAQMKTIKPVKLRRYPIPAPVSGISGFQILSQSGKEYRLFANQDGGPGGVPFQPSVVELFWTHESKEVAIGDSAQLFIGDHKPLWGSPNLEMTGLNLQGLVPAGDGKLWMVDGNVVSLMAFNGKGQWLESHVPQTSRQMGRQTLPKMYANTPSGFGGITYEKGLIYAVMRAPVATPKDFTQSLARLLVFDVYSRSLRGEYLIPLKSRESTFEGIAALGDRRFLVLEKTGPQHRVLRFSLASASNLKHSPRAHQMGAKLETYGAEGVGKFGIRPAHLTLVFDTSVVQEALPEHISDIGVLRVDELLLVSHNGYKKNEDGQAVEGELILVKLPGTALGGKRPVQTPWASRWIPKIKTLKPPAPSIPSSAG